MSEQSDTLKGQPFKYITRPNQSKSRSQIFLVPSLILIGILIVCVIQQIINLRNFASTLLFQTFNLQQSCEVHVAEFHEFIKNPREIYPSQYFQATAGRLFLPFCKQINKFDIIQWSRQNTIISWAKMNVRIGAIVIYDRPDQINYLELLFLSILVGPFGKIYTTNQFDWECYDEIRILYKNFKNVNFIETYPGLYEKYQIIISSNRDMIYRLVQQNHWKNKYSQPQKILFSIQKQKILKQKQLYERFLYNEQLILSNVWINVQNCDNIIHIQEIKQFQFIQNVKKKIVYFEGKSRNYLHKTDSQLIKQIQQAEKKAKSVLIKTQQKYRRNMSEVEKIQDIKKFQDLKKQYKNQQHEKQVIQWVKKRSQINYNIYYDNPEVSISIIERMALLVPHGKIYVHCSKTNQEFIRKNIQQTLIKNIFYIRNDCLECQDSHLLIINNIQFLRKFLEKNKPIYKYILWRIPEKNDESLDLFYNLYAKFHLNKVEMLSRNQNQQVLLEFKNVLFCIDNPFGLFQIKNQQYVIYVYWNNSLQALKKQQNIHQNLVQLIQINIPEVKLIFPHILHYFELPTAPFHKGFYHLSEHYRSDYIHGYLINYYGGGYANIRGIQFDWIQYFIQLQKSPENIYGIGYFESYIERLSCKNEKQCRYRFRRKNKDKKLLGKGQHIFKKKNPITQKWMNNMNQILQKNYQNLQLLPEQRRKNFDGFQTSKLNRLIEQTQFGWEYVQMIENENSGHMNKNFPPLIIVE